MESSSHNPLFESPSHWIIRIGQGIFITLLAICFIFCCYLQFPNTLKADVSVVSLSPRIRLSSKATGYIQLSVRDHDYVRKGQLLCIIRSSIDDVDNIINLRKKLEEIYSNKALFDSLDVFDKEVFSDEIQPFYDDFLKSIRTYCIYMQLNQTKNKKEHLLRKLALNKKLKKIGSLKTQSITQKLDIQSREINDSKLLFKDSIISNDELRKLEKEALEQTVHLESSKADNMQLLITDNEIKNQMKEIENEDATTEVKLHGDITDRFTILLSKVIEWESSHLIRAPHPGRVYFTSHWTSGLMINSGTELLSIIPKNENIFGIAKVRSFGAGDIKAGQDVKIFIDNYPLQEYGFLKGKVSSISPVLNDTIYNVWIKLPDGLKTSYGKKLTFSPELHGQGEILTRKMSVVQKIFYRFKSFSPSN